MKDKKVFIISNESIQDESNNYFCDNLDLKSIPEGLNEFFNINVIARKSKFKRYHPINEVNIKVASNILSYIKLVLESLKDKHNSKYLVISISPFTFIATIILFLFKIKPLVYLRSDGYEEYKSIMGFIGLSIYHFMFSVTASISNLISCRKHILKKKLEK